MEQRPEQPPEGKLISDAAASMKMSIREAARRAGISYGRWRQVVQGYQNVSPGSYAPVRAPARTLARMAAATGITPEQLESEGRRPDAAEELRRIEAVRAVPDPDRAPARMIGIIGDAADAEALEPYIRQVNRQLASAVAEYGPEPPPAVIFTDITEQSAWTSPRLTPGEKVHLIAVLRLFAAEARAEHEPRTGLAGT